MICTPPTARIMRAATWATNRHINAARAFGNVPKIADTLPSEDPNQAAMRIAPRTMLCAIAVRVHEHVAGDRFEELRQLCAAAGDKASLAIAMAGLVADHALQDRIREASQLASEAWTLAESIGDPTLTVGLSFPVIYAKGESGEWGDVLPMSRGLSTWPTATPQRATSLSGPRSRSPLRRGVLPRYCLGRPMARRPAPRPGHGPQRRPHAHATVVAGTTAWGYPFVF